MNNYRMILIESNNGITIEQEIEICETIGKILQKDNSHIHIQFDRHFADKEDIDKYNLSYKEIEE